MKQTIVFTLTALLLASCAAVCAQSMVQVDSVGQVLVYSKGGTVEGCGVRAVGVVPSGTAPHIKTFDVSANLWRSGASLVSLVKLLGELTPFDGVRATGKASRVPLFNGWLKAAGKPPAAPQEKGFKESLTDKGAYLFPADLDGTFHFIWAAEKGEPVQVGLSWDGKTEWVYFGKIALSAAEASQLHACMTEILR